MPSFHDCVETSVLPSSTLQRPKICRYRQQRRDEDIMSTVIEIERAIEHLTPEELEVFRAWFAERDAAAWDHQLEIDVATGKLDTLGDQAIREHREGRTTDL
jgi:hypothetical protein